MSLSVIWDALTLTGRASGHHSLTSVSFCEVSLLSLLGYLSCLPPYYSLINPFPRPLPFPTVGAAALAGGCPGTWLSSGACQDLHLRLRVLADLCSCGCASQSSQGHGRAHTSARQGLWHSCVHSVVVRPHTVRSPGEGCQVGLWHSAAPGIRTHGPKLAGRHRKTPCPLLWVPLVKGHLPVVSQTQTRLWAVTYRAHVTECHLALVFKPPFRPHHARTAEARPSLPGTLWLQRLYFLQLSWPCLAALTTREHHSESGSCLTHPKEENMTLATTVGFTASLHPTSQPLWVCRGLVQVQSICSLSH